MLEKIEIETRRVGEPMDIFVAVFNRHINSAHNRAKAAYIAKFGKRSWRKHLQPHDEKGIMAIFNIPPSDEVKWYAEKVQEFVNGHTAPTPAE